MTKKAKLFFITGASTAGKTTLIPELRKQLPDNFIVYDFDQRGVPNNVTEDWRKDETTHWLNVGIKNAQKNKNTVICGISLPNEVMTNKKLLNHIEVHYGLLDVSAKEIAKRFNNRLSTTEMKKDWERTVGLSLEESIEQNIKFASSLRKICKQYDCKIFDTSRSNAQKTTLRVAEWIISSL